MKRSSKDLRFMCDMLQKHCTCSRMQHMSRWVSRAWSRAQFPELRGAMTKSSSEADWLFWERRPRLLRVLCWKELMLMDKNKKRGEMTHCTWGQWGVLVIILFCLWTHPLSFSLRLPKQEVSSSALKSCDRKSKLPRTSSTARVSSDDELLSRERSFWGRTPQGMKTTHSVFNNRCVCVCAHRYLQYGCQVQNLVVQGSQLLLRAALVL